jgi:CheY-like chemotaxis protein
VLAPNSWIAFQNTISFLWSGTSPSESAPSVAQYAGAWTGTTGQSLPVYFRINSAGEGEEALSVFEAHRQEVRLVISDLEMPKLDGINICLTLKKSKRQLEFIIVSGFINAATQSHLTAVGLKHVLHKPYTPDHIVNTVRRLLSAGGSPAP